MTLVCGVNEQFSACHTPCQPSCDDPTLAPCPPPTCTPGCHCQPASSVMNHRFNLASLLYGLCCQ
ncbi:trypsin Inhibitor like cysteine rich domain protein [Teladorsagia circumcincta]|uniref:Trypsin Inhibitor like cysteine rich domain protein n=1 Tax=Teladorsagia circumcincta TaxID=45464 RepID=A0A2G9U3K7_TELCI|nr:trypsin Inhibitor like cysteine rich domain protein [Teladorsagia circumcincta]